jgi:hypothetical protein
MTELPAELDASSPASTTRTLDDQAYEFDVLVLDGATRQSLACVRSLGRAGLRVAVGETSDHIDSAHPALGLRSRYAARAVVLPSFTPDASAFVAAVTEFVRAHPTRVVLPTGDRVIGALLPVRDQFAAAGSTLALPPTPALDIANNKDRTIEIALGLGIRCPRSAHIDSLDKLPGLLAGFSFPFVLKPTASWAPLAPDRLQTIEVVSEAELTAVTREFLSAGVGVLAQEWVGGRREEIDLFMVGGEVRASFAWVMNRTFPTLGGVSSARASIALPPDTYAMAVDLVRAAGLDGMCDVDFPLLIWQWASGLAVDEIQGYRAGVRARWLRGELRWLWNNLHEGGRPDSVSRTRAVWTFLAEFARTRHYDCLDWRDLRPVIAEFRSTAVQSVTGRRPDF